MFSYGSRSKITWGRRKQCHLCRGWPCLRKRYLAQAQSSMSTEMRNNVIWKKPVFISSLSQSDVHILAAWEPARPTHTSARTTRGAHGAQTGTALTHVHAPGGVCPHMEANGTPGQHHGPGQQAPGWPVLPSSCPCPALLRLKAQGWGRSGVASRELERHERRPLSLARATKQSAVEPAPLDSFQP